MKKIKEISSTIFEDVKFFELESFNDNRGSFKEVYNQEIESILGSINFIQDNESISSYGVLRGLHYQKKPYEQSKLIRVSLGEIQDVIVDIREESNTYGRWESYNISSKNNRVLFIPKGFAHGFLVLSKKAIVTYKVDNCYNKDFESGINYNDCNLKIKWKLNEKEIIINDKDTSYPKFNK
ncbi:MAG: dTDP-4-dehydrorhamnose 3,5-epimerase [Candidatus Marinimicrobia bacterium]|nr:dTDP-4-dehydrorhamnose 3,5-epimerase [Candidatus Neomarinimicrobiota bacterium]|tara:strand:+ start:17610 stop:18152 length:543 start_codon:yes stop_codon:yes gene_type:complete